MTRMDISEWRKMSQVEKDEYMITFWGTVKNEIHAIGTKLDNVAAELGGRIAPLETKIQELTDNVDTNVAAVTGLATRMDDLEDRLNKVVEPSVDNDIKTENVTVVNEFMTGQQRILEKIAQQNSLNDQQNGSNTQQNGSNNQQNTQQNGSNNQQNGLNNSMPWQRTAGGSGGFGGSEEKPKLFAGGSRPIFGGMQGNEDKIIKLWELSRVDAVDNIYNGVLMWWPALSEVDAEDFNTLNFFEAGLSDSQVSWCKSLVYVPDRSLYVSQGEENVHRYNETCAKLDDQFRKNAPEFAVDDDVIFFDDYLERFWMTTRRYHMTNHQVCKEILFDKCVGVRTACGYTLKPADMENRQLTLKGYLCKMRETFLPPDMKNVCKDAYLSVKQHENDKIDAFFDKILSFWKRAYPKPTDDMFMDFYSQVCNVVLSPLLANQMRQFALDLERDGQVRMITKFRTELIVKAQLIVKGLQFNQISGSMARGCTTNQMALAKTMVGGVGSKSNPVTIDQVSDEDNLSYEINQCEIDLADEFGGPAELIPLIGAIQGGFICYYCNRKGHMMRDCFDIRDKKLPNPKGKYFLRWGNKPFVPYKTGQKSFKKNENSMDKKKLVGEIEGEVKEGEDTKEVAHVDGLGASDYEDDLVAEVEAWNNAIIDDILWF